MMATRRIGRSLLHVVLCALPLSFEADGNFGQTEQQSSRELLEAKQKRFLPYQSDFTNFADFAKSHPNLAFEWEIAVELHSVASENNERLGAITTLLRIYEEVIATMTWQESNLC